MGEFSGSATPAKRRNMGVSSQSSLRAGDQTLFDAESETEVEDVVSAGRIVRMQMVNFMCHENQEIVFNPRINFISGKNGSGKSAIVTALTVVLGGTANETGRARAVADLIRSGQNAGRLLIEIRNEGVNAYDPAVYGDRITIIRSFTRTGSNSYTIKAKSGNVVSKKKKDVDKICDALHLAVGNPICVLNQDVAREFLSNTNSKVRYRLFMQATQLDKLQELHEEAVSALTDATSTLDRKNEVLKEAKTEVDALKKKLKYLLSLKEVTIEKIDLERELIWKQVMLEEDAVEELKKEKELLEKKIEEFNSAVANHQTRLGRLNDEANSIKEAMNKVMGKKEAVAQQKRTYNAEVMRVQTAVTQQETSLNLSLPRLQRILGDIERVKEYMQQFDERNNESEVENAKVLKRTKEVQAELQEIQERYVVAERDLDNANETKVRTREEQAATSSLMRDLERNKAHKQSQLMGMQGQGDMETLRFGAFVPRLLQAIDDADKRKQFQRKPIGPIGMHLQLNCDPKWAAAIESVVGGVMTSYCCDNSKDFKVLSRIMDEVVGKKQPSIIISKFQSHRHDVARNKVKVPGHQTILDGLTFTDDTAFNTVVDQCSVESILLFEKDEQAAAMLTHVENVPRGLRMGVTLACDKYYPAPNYRTYAGRATTRYFNQSNRREDVIAKLEVEIKSLEREVAQQKVTMGAHRATQEKMDSFTRRTEERLREMGQRRQALDMELSGLRDQEQCRPVPRTRLALEEELEVLEKKREELEQERAVKQEAIAGILRSGETAKSKLDECNKQLEKLQRDIDQLDSDLNRIEDAKNTQEFVQRNAGAQLEQLQQQLSTSSERQAIAIVELRTQTEEAQAMCERVESTRTAQEIMTLLEKKESYLKAAEKMCGSKQEVTDQFQEKHATYIKKFRDQEAMQNIIDSMAKSANSRVELFIEKRRCTAREIADYFQAGLTTRNYDGTLQFDFDDGTLELRIYPRANDLSDQRTDAKTLSGGERSYSTVTFILAMWRAVRMPFYFLDEFDVFMDKVNRKVVMDLLVLYAKEMTQTQFVFITPQDISSIEASDITSIFNMPDPVRVRKRPSNASDE